MSSVLNKFVHKLCCSPGRLLPPPDKELDKIMFSVAFVLPTLLKKL